MLLYFGRNLNMGKKEILNTEYAELCDMISCHAIIKNGAEQKNKNKGMAFADVMKLR